MSSRVAFCVSPNFALDRLSRYEATLWRQAGRILYALDALDRRRIDDRPATAQKRVSGLSMLLVIRRGRSGIAKLMKQRQNGILEFVLKRSL